MRAHIRKIIRLSYEPTLTSDERRRLCVELDKANAHKEAAAIIFAIMTRSWRAPEWKRYRQRA